MAPTWLTQTAQSWAYDVTFAFAISIVWWLSALFASRSKTVLASTGDWNLAWSCFTCLFILGAVLSFAVEQALRTCCGTSVPTSVSIVVAASLSYVVSSDNLRMFDRNARLVQTILTADKARFGGPVKYTIQHSRWKSGIAEDERHWLPDPNIVDRLVLWDWGLSHRIGSLSEEDIWKSMKNGGIDFWATLGSMLYFWLPSGAHEHLHFDRKWLEGRLRKAYKASMGRRIDAYDPKIPFDDWMLVRGSDSYEKHFKLIAMEYNTPTKQVLSDLGQIVSDASTPRDVANGLIRKWASYVCPGQPEHAAHQP